MSRAMLRKKFMAILGVIITLHVVMAFLSILVLNSVLGDLDEAGAEALESVAAIQRVRAELDAASPRPDEDVGVLVALNRSVAGLGEIELMQEPVSADLIGRVREQIIALHEIATGAADGAVTDTWRIPIRNALDDLDSHVNEMIAFRRDAITSKFRNSVIVLGIVFVLIINATVMVLSRMVSMIVKPVDKLVEASRRLAEEDFEYRVELNRSDEFAELARAQNALAEQLQQNEERKVETLHQVARTLSHELNNAIAIIELQLTHLARKNKGDGEQAERLKEIHRTLERISRTVDALAHVRRIVLTDYTSGVSMLDLERSIEEGPAVVRH
jgi:nitrate/nitrite-specific signal transduction histidine kinase